MSRFRCLSLVGAAAGLALAAAALAWPAYPFAWPASWHLPDLARDAAEAERLAELGARVYRRVTAKDKAVAALVDGRLTLAEAVARFRDLNAEAPAATEAVRNVWPAAMMDEALSRQVLDWALLRAETTCPERVSEIKGRLEDQARTLWPDH